MSTAGRGLEAARTSVARWRAGELLFDLDGTLIDSVPAVEEAWRLLAAEEGVTPPAGHRMHGRTAEAVLRSLLPEARVPGALARLEELESDPGLPIRPLPGAVELLGGLPTGRWAIVTSSTRAVAETRIRAAGLPRPERLVTADDVTRGKPDPEPYQRGRHSHRNTSRRNTEPEVTAHEPDTTRAGAIAAAVAVEDTVAGLRAARAAGCLTAGVLGTAPVEELLPHADVVIPSLREVRVREKEDGLEIELRGAHG